MVGKRPSKKLSDEDVRLWRRIAETARPLRPEGDARASPAEAMQAEPARRPRARSAPGPTQARSSHGPPPLAVFDAREARRIAGGRQAIDARVDLHGLRQREAHRRLKAFLVHAQAQGHRTVLIITGKGARGRGEEQTVWERRDRGVLKMAVPRWLAEPDFRAYVVGFAPAHLRHGGEGALYARLRRLGRRS